MISALIFIISIFALIILESFLGALGGVSIIFVFIMVAFGKFDWRVLLAFVVVISLCLDVVNHYVLGASLLLLGVSLGVFLLISLFVPVGMNMTGLIPYFVAFLGYYFFGSFLPSLISFGGVETITWAMLGASFVKALVSVALLVVGNIWVQRFRGNKLSSKLSFR